MVQTSGWQQIKALHLSAPERQIHYKTLLKILLRSTPLSVCHHIDSFMLDALTCMHHMFALPKLQLLNKHLFAKEKWKCVPWWQGRASKALFKAEAQLIGIADTWTHDDFHAFMKYRVWFTEHVSVFCSEFVPCVLFCVCEMHNVLKQQNGPRSVIFVLVLKKKKNRQLVNSL